MNRNLPQAYLELNQKTRYLEMINNQKSLMIIMSELSSYLKSPNLVVSNGDLIILKDNLVSSNHTTNDNLVNHFLK